MCDGSLPSAAASERPKYSAGTGLDRQRETSHVAWV
jgi:hypothetical protein